MPLKPRLSVVIATLNRLPLLQRLLEQLAKQTLPPESFEVVVVDGGSAEPVRGLLETLSLPYPLRVEEQPGASVASARHQGVLVARADIILLTHDDVRLPEDFLQSHLARHTPGSRKVVLGGSLPDAGVMSAPLFDRWYAWVNDRKARRLSDKRQRVHGWHLDTANVSFRREDYVAVGGFDKELSPGEGMELGVRLEKHGCRFELIPEACVIRDETYTGADSFIRRARHDGIVDARVASRHADVAQLNPWRMHFESNPLVRPQPASGVSISGVARPGVEAMLHAVQVGDWLGFKRMALAGTSLAYAVEYLSGAREEEGSWSAVLRDGVRYKLATGWAGQLRQLKQALKDDAVELTRAEHGEVNTRAMVCMVLGSDAWRVLALQRLREAARGMRIPLGNHALRVAQTALLGVEIGKHAELGRGVYFVHSLGTVIAGDSRVGERVRFYGNNTVGTAKDNGHPVIEDDVWVGAGARILGPITVGARSCIGANAVVLQDVPPDSVAVGIPARILPRTFETEGEAIYGFAPNRGRGLSSSSASVA